MKSFSKHLLFLVTIFATSTALSSQTVQLNRLSLTNLTIEQKQALSLDELASLDFQTLIELSDELSDYALSSGVAITVENLAVLDLNELMVISEGYEGVSSSIESENEIIIPLVTLSKLELSSLMKVSVVEESNMEESHLLQCNRW